MTINGIRLFPFGCVMALAASFAGGQTSPLPPAGTTETLAVPAQPATPASLPPRPPRVTCAGDQLTIAADNSTLESILAAVRGCSGAKIEIPAGAGEFRSFEQLGPGPFRQVLDSLLSGTPFNFVILSSETNPGKLESVEFTVQKKDSTSPNSPPADLSLTPARRTWLASRKTGRPDLAAAEEAQGATEEAASPKEGSAAEPAETPDANIPAAPNAAPAIPVPGADAIANADPAKTEDKITSMQQMFEQRRQLNIQQNSPPSRPLLRRPIRVSEGAKELTSCMPAVAAGWAGLHLETGRSGPHASQTLVREAELKEKEFRCATAWCRWPSPGRF